MYTVKNVCQKCHLEVCILLCIYYYSNVLHKTLLKYQTFVITHLSHLHFIDGLFLDTKFHKYQVTLKWQDWGNEIQSSTSCLLFLLITSFSVLIHNKLSTQKSFQYISSFHSKVIFICLIEVIQSIALSGIKYNV